MNEKEHHVANIWWQLHIHIGDVVISILLGMIFFLLVEAPTNQAVRIFCSRQAKNKSSDTIQLPFKQLNENKWVEDASLGAFCFNVYLPF